MKQSMSRSLALAMALALVLLTAACGTGGGPASPAGGSSAAPAPAPTNSGGPAAEERTLTIWHAAFVNAEQRALPESEWEFTKICREFEAANPGVTVEGVYQTDQGVMQNTLKASVLAGTAPDIVNAFGDYQVTTLKDIFVDLTVYYSTDDLEHITGWESVSENLMNGSPIYGYPTAGSEMGIFIYNKQIAAGLGLDLEGADAPANAEEFMALLRTVKAAGVLPIVANDDGANTLFMFATGNWSLADCIDTLGEENVGTACSAATSSA